MIKEVVVKFVDDERTNKIVDGKRRPKTRKKRIVKKWMKRYAYTAPETGGCAIVGYKPGEGGLIVYAVAHPEAKPFLENMNNQNSGNQPIFTFMDDVS